MILQFIANGIAQGAVYGLVALGFSLIYRITKVFNIAQGATYTLSAYIFYTIFRILNLPVYAGIVFGFVSGILFVTITERFIFYTLYKREASAGVNIIASLGVYIFMVNLIALVYGNETKILNPGIEKTFTIGNVILTRIQIFEIIAILIAGPLLFIYLSKSKTGRKIRGLIDNPRLCLALGMDIKRVRIIGCSLGAFLICLASILVAMDVGIDPQIGIGAILNGAVGMIIGGITSLPGAGFGGMGLGIIQNLVVYQTSAKWQNTVTFAILIIFLIFKPEGIFGVRKRVEEQ